MHLKPVSQEVVQPCFRVSRYGEALNNIRDNPLAHNCRGIADTDMIVLFDIGSPGGQAAM